MADTAAAQSLRAVIIDREPARFLAGLGKILAPRTKGANPDLFFLPQPNYRTHSDSEPKNALTITEVKLMKFLKC